MRTSVGPAIGTNAPKAASLLLDGRARKVGPCSALSDRMPCQSSSGPVTASTACPEKTAQASSWEVSQNRRRNGAMASSWCWSSSRCRVGRCARTRAEVSASSVRRRTSSRAVAPARSTRALPCSSASPRSIPIAVADNPTPTSSTSSTWTATIHQPRLVSAGSGQSAFSWRRKKASMESSPAISGPLHQRLEGQSREREQCEEGGDRERRGEVVVVVQRLDGERHGIGQSPDVARDYRHGSEFSHGACIAENHPVKQSPADLGQGDTEEGHPGPGAQSDGRLLLVVAE